MNTLRGLLALAIACLAVPAHSQDQLEPLTVSASRVATPQRGVSGALTVLTREDITKQQASYVYEVLQSVPGLNVSTQGSNGSLSQVRIRGAEANQVLVIIDGIEVNDPANAAEFNFAYLTTDNIHSIEILRGPQSALWGSDALAGVIKITTTSHIKGRHFSARSSYGSNNLYQGSMQLLAGSEQLDFSLSGNFIDSDGINSSTTGHERDGYDNATVNVSSRYQFDDDMSIGFSGRYTNASNEFDPAPTGVPVDGFGRNNVEQFYLRGFFEWNTFNDHWAHVFESSYVDTGNDSVDELFGSSRSAASKEKFSYQSSIFFPVSTMLDSRQTLTLAIEREQERFKQHGAAFPGFNPNQRQKITHYGKVVEYRANILRSWTLSAALRHDNNDEFDNQSTYRVGINYQHAPSQTTVYAARATGVKNPTFTELFGFAPNNFLGNPALDAETSSAWEVGIGRAFFNNKLDIQAAFFWEDLEDEIQTVFLPTFQSTVINSESKSKRNGLELSFANQVTETITLRGSYTYLDASEPDSLDNHRTEIRRPKQQASGQIDVSFLNNKANLNVTINHIGDRRDIDFSSGNRVTLDDYTLVNLALNYQVGEQCKLFARTSNLFDEDYQDVFGFETNKFTAAIGVEFNL